MLHWYLGLFFPFSNERERERELLCNNCVIAEGVAYDRRVELPYLNFFALEFYSVTILRQ